MQLKAIYDHGRLEFSESVVLKHDPVEVVVEIADDEVEMKGNSYNLPNEVIAAAREMQNKLDEIRNAPSPPDNELPELTEKQIQRMEAMELRETYRKERGHTA